MQKLARKLVAAVLGWQVRRLQRKNDFKVVAVAGSIGKTSTKLAIVSVLKQKFKVQYQHGNYNDLISVPLIYFGHGFEEHDKLPMLYNPFSWLKIFIQNEKVIRQNYPYEVVVIELGPDGPGQMAQFKPYVRVDIGVLTAITPEHMEFFGDMATVAKEELILADLSKKLIYNHDLCPPKYMKGVRLESVSYGLNSSVDFGLTNVKFDEYQSEFEVTHKNKTILKTRLQAISEPQLYSALAAIATGHEMGVSSEQIKTGLDSIKPFHGRMQHLKGINKSLIIDDSYNASPQAMKAALDTIYRIKAPQKIAVLGNMNELGDHSPQAHTEIGEYCDPKKVDLVLTLGPDANKFLAPAAEAKGCKVQSFTDPFALGEYLKSIIRNGAAVLIKGSQNNVYSEEAIKPILADPKDIDHLVRQTPGWLKVKQRNFQKA